MSERSQGPVEGRGGNKCLEIDFGRRSLVVVLVLGGDGDGRGGRR